MVHHCVEHKLDLRRRPLFLWHYMLAEFFTRKTLLDKGGAIGVSICSMLRNLNIYPPKMPHAQWGQLTLYSPEEIEIFIEALRRDPNKLKNLRKV